jgi:hypothetical protein
LKRGGRFAVSAKREGIAGKAVLFRLFASLRLCSDPANQPIFKEQRE